MGEGSRRPLGSFASGGEHGPRSRVARVVESVVRLFGNYSEHRMGTYAAALAYRGLFGLFPFVLILVALASVLVPPGWLDGIVEEIKSRTSQQVPEQLAPVVEQGKEQIQPLEAMVDQAQKQVGGELLLVGVGVALWTISALASTLADACDTAYGVPVTRRGWRKMALSLASGPLFALAVMVAVGLMLIGPQVVEGVADLIGLKDLVVVLWAWLRFPVALLLLWVVLVIVYRYGSAARQSFGSVALGAAVAVTAWAIASLGFSVYLANFADYGVTYGSLGAAVGLLVYLYLSASIVLFGVELNAEIHRSFARKSAKTSGPDPDRETRTAQDGKTGYDEDTEA